MGSPEDFLDRDGPAAPPRANGELVFEAPWESRVFGLAVALREQGVLDAEDFRRHLIAEIAEWERAHPDGAGWSYYACWQRALEAALSESGLCTRDELDAREREFADRPAGHDH